MSSPLSLADVCEKFATLAIAQKVPVFQGDDVEKAALFISHYVKALVHGEDFVFTVDPEVFIKEAYQALATSGFPWINKEVERRRTQLEATTSKINVMFLDAVNVYMARCQIHESLLEMDFSEKLNYFIKKDEEGVCPLKGPFEKVPSTFFGNQELDFWDIEFPESGDIAVIYTNEGFLRMILRYNGKVVQHY